MKTGPPRTHYTDVTRIKSVIQI